MGTLIIDPNAPPDPTQVAPIPDHQSFGDEWVGRTHNPVLPGAPPDPDHPTGTPPSQLEDDKSPRGDHPLLHERDTYYEEKRWRTMQQPEQLPAKPPVGETKPAAPEKPTQQPASEPSKPEPKHDKADDKHAAHKK